MSRQEIYAFYQPSEEQKILDQLRRHLKGQKVSFRHTLLRSSIVGCDQVAREAQEVFDDAATACQAKPNR